MCVILDISVVFYTKFDLKLRNKLHVPMHRCYMCTQWTRVLYSVVLTRQSNPSISQFTSFWSKFVYNIMFNVFCSAGCGYEMGSER